MPEPAPGLDFLVRKSDWRTHRFDEVPTPELADGQVLFRVDRFAFTANNISYALAGDLLGYWRLFPAPDGWGRLPTMGFGDVIHSRHPAVAEGVRCFGFYPMSRYLVIEPGAAGPAQIVDGAAHRAGLAPAYNQYAPVGHDALYAPGHEDTLMLLRGLFLTAFLAEDFLAEHDHYGATAVVISSASSKTAIALAHQLSRAGRVRAVGLTSARNREFVNRLGCYDQVVGYDEVASLDAEAPAVFVDMAGSGPVRSAIHTHLGAGLRYSCSVGATHWDAGGDDAAALPGPKPEFFFAPARIQERAAEWGPVGYQERLAKAWSDFRAFSTGWLQVQRGSGREAVERVYGDTLEGRTRPEDGHVLSLWDAAAPTASG